MARTVITDPKRDRPEGTLVLSKDSSLSSRSALSPAARVAACLQNCPSAPLLDPVIDLGFVIGMSISRTYSIRVQTKQGGRAPAWNSSEGVISPVFPCYLHPQGRPLREFHLKRRGGGLGKFVFDRGSEYISSIEGGHIRPR